MKFIKIISICAVTTMLTSLHAARVTISQQIVDPTTISIKADVTLAPQEMMYKDFISFSIDHPDVTLTPWQSDREPVDNYVPSMRTTKAVFNESFALHLEAHKAESADIKKCSLHMTYLSSAHRSMIEYITELTFVPSCPVPNPAPSIQKENASLQPESFTKPLPSLSSLKISALSDYVSSIIQTTNLLWVRILLIALLGLLMSLTPCIYPMIPITIGIMQGQGDRSLFTNFLHAFAYTLGIATTFALLGLLAALSGAIFGMLLTNPLVVLIIVGFLIYLALSMFGLYEMRIPRFLQERSSRKHHGSVISSFLFGALSGTVASPCLSPGLALVLTMVATLGNKFLGFILLFSFGIGLSIPLLLIGTFSSSLNLMPQAGHWMVEIKKIFGFLLLGMSFYYLKNILPAGLVSWLIAFFVAGAGFYYLYSIRAHDTRLGKRLKNGIGTACLAASVLLFVQAFQTIYYQQPVVDTFWHTDYDTALMQARQNNQLMFIDFWAPSCSICMAIEKMLFKDPAVRKALARFIPTKIELISSNAVIQSLRTQFNIIGLPTIILYDPTNNVVLKRWGGELYQAEKQAFIQELQQY